MPCAAKTAFAVSKYSAIRSVPNPGMAVTFRGTRLPVQTLFDYLANGLSLDYFLETFEGITREHARQVLRFGWERIATEVAG